jgi:hypothetical protein
MIGKYATIFTAVAGLTLAATQAQAESRFSFLNKYIEKYAKVKDGDTIAGFDLDKITSRLESKSSSGSGRLSSLRNRLNGTTVSPAATTAQK